MSTSTSCATPRPEELLRLWARKEAVIKARGLGSYVAVGDIDVLDAEVEGGWLCSDLDLGDRVGLPRRSRGPSASRAWWLAPETSIGASRRCPRRPAVRSPRAAAERD